MGKWILVGFGVIVVVIAIALIIGRAREATKVDGMVEMLIARGFESDADAVDFDSLSDLPTPVARYFKNVLAENQKLIKIARMNQSGMLRTSMKTDAWSSFTSHQVVVPPATGHSCARSGQLQRRSRCRQG